MGLDPGSPDVLSAVIGGLALGMKVVLQNFPNVALLAVYVRVSEMFIDSMDRCGEVQASDMSAMAAQLGDLASEPSEPHQNCASCSKRPATGERGAWMCDTCAAIVTEAQQVMAALRPRLGGPGFTGPGFLPPPPGYQVQFPPPTGTEEGA
jgi:hypothetical protein